MKFCSTCGQELQPNMVFCTKCGAEVKEEQDKPLIQNTNEINRLRQPVKKEKAKLSKKTIVMIGSLSLACLLLFFIGSRVFSTKETKYQAAKSTKIVNISSFTYRNGDYYGIIDTNLNVIDPEVASVIMPFNAQGVAPYHMGDDSYTWGLMDSKGTIIKEPFASSINIFGNYISNSLQSKNGTMHFTIYANDEDIEESEQGLINSKGEIVYRSNDHTINPFDGASFATFFENDFIGTGVVSEAGEIIIEPVYNAITILNDQYLAVQKDNASDDFDIIDLKGKIIKENFSRNPISPFGSENRYFINENNLGKYNLLDAKFKEVLTSFSSGQPSISEDGKYLVFAENDKYGLMTIKGDVLIAAEYDYLNVPNAQGTLLASQDDDAMILDINGEELYYGDETLSPIYGTDLFSESVYDEDDELMTQIIDAQGNYKDSYNDMIYDYHGPKTIGYTLLRSVGEYSLTVLTSEGDFLAEDVIHHVDLGKELFLQFSDDRFQIVDKKTGNIKKEKVIETEPSTSI